MGEQHKNALLASDLHPILALIKIGLALSLVISVVGWSIMAAAFDVNPASPSIGEISSANGAVVRDHVVNRTNFITRYENVIGGYTTGNQTTITNNSVNIKDDGTWLSYIAGGYANGTNSNVIDNRVNFINDLNDQTYGYGGFTRGNNSNVSSNMLSLLNNTEFSEGELYGGYAAGNSSHITSNIVNIGDNAEVNSGKIVGGEATGSGSTVENNSVILMENALASGGVEIIGGEATGSGSTVENNSVILMENALASGEIIGGQANGVDSNVSSNRVNITDTVRIGWGSTVYGGYARGADSIVSNNRVSIMGNASLDFSMVYGGYANTSNSNATGNIIEFSENASSGGNTEIFGALIGNGTAANNSVIVSGNAKIENVIYGAYSTDTVTFINNSISVSENSSVKGNLYGAYSGSLSNPSRLTNNSVFISGNGEVIEQNGMLHIYGAFGGNYSVGNSVILSDNAKASGNSLQLTAALLTVGSGFAANNSVILSGNAMISGRMVYGVNGGGSNSIYTNNKIALYDNSIINASIIGVNGLDSSIISSNSVEFYGNSKAGSEITAAKSGSSSTSNLTGNSVSFFGDTILGVNDDGRTVTNVYAAQSQGIIEGNYIILGDGASVADQDGNILNLYGGYASGSYSSVTNNSVILKDGSSLKNGVIYGGYALWNDSNVSSNIVSITANAESVKDVYGGYANRGNSNVFNNTVILTNANISGNVYGGYSADGSSNTTNNSVVLRGATIYGNLYSGYGGVTKNNDIAFESGKNEFHGEINATGDLRILGGENIANSKTTANNIDVRSGITTFNSDIITGNFTTKQAGEVLFNGSKLEATGLVNFSSTASNAHSFNGNVSIESANDAILGDSAVIHLLADSKLSLSSSGLKTSSHSRLNLKGDATLEVLGGGGLDVGGDIMLDKYDLMVNGDVAFQDGSKIIIDFDDSTNQQGSMTIDSGDKVKLYGQSELALSPSNNLDEDQPIVFAQTNGYDLIDGAAFFTSNSALKVVFRESDQSYSLKYKTLEEIEEDIHEDNNTPIMPNDPPIIDLIDEILDEYYNGNDDLKPLAEKLQKFMVDSGNAPATFIERVIRQNSGEAIVNIQSSVIDTALKSQGVVLRRIDRIYEASAAAPPAAGSADTFNRVWVGGFGSWAKQKDTDGYYGYDFNIGGVTLGYDRRVESVPGLRLGVASSFSSGDLKSNSGWASVDVKTIGVGAYGSYLFNNGLFVDANVGYGHSENESTIKLIGGDQKTGKFDINTWQVGARLGLILNAGSWNIIPTAGVRYMKIKQDGFSERLSSPNPYAIANVFDKKSSHIVDIPLLLKIKTTFNLGSAKISPELRLGYTFVVKKPDNSLNLGFVGSDYRTTVYGIKPSRGSFQGGFGLKIALNDRFDIYLNYDLDKAQKFTNHNFAIGIGFNF
ncbi:MAG: autotransporter domain-containing protein [Deltaproteobacteria bacterium]|jgi:outer membrane autotransporter protein|nr:autotransporter domain-containing protein [Deltaproteobacteria bacterium]